MKRFSKFYAELVTTQIQAGSMSIFATVTIIGIALAIAFIARIPAKSIMQNYSYDVIVILVVMEMFTNLIGETGLMEWLATKLSVFSKGKRKLCLFCFGSLMFLISCTLNNITAVMMILPIVFVLLDALRLNRKFVNSFFGVILALSNTGGAASPIGDFPAIVIMTSGITTFNGYLTRAFPLFAITSVVLLLIWSSTVHDAKSSAPARDLAISFLNSLYKHHHVKWDVVRGIGLTFALMFVAWSVVPQNAMPPECIALAGYACAATFCSIKHIRVHQNVNMKSVLLIASFLFLATTISQCGILSHCAQILQSSVADPTSLLLTIMVMTSICAGLFGAGPAAAAMMPVVVELCRTAFAAQADWVAIAYAASICAGSSLFMSSATAGFILSERVSKAGLTDECGCVLEWNMRNYLIHGFINYAIQLAIAVIWILLCIKLSDAI